MRSLLLLLLALSFAACKSHSNAKPEAVAPAKTTPENLGRWSGLTDFSDNKWQIKSQP